MSSHQQLLYHVVFSTKERRPLLRDDEFREGVWRYMAGVTHHLQGHALRVGGYIDHAHLLLRIPAKIAVADFVRQLESSTSKHINEESGSQANFHWQDGYGAFTVSRSKADAVMAYIDRQMEHHQQKSFQVEYLKMLQIMKWSMIPSTYGSEKIGVSPSGLRTFGHESGGLRHRQGCFALRATSIGPRAILDTSPNSVANAFRCLAI